MFPLPGSLPSLLTPSDLSEFTQQKVCKGLTCAGFALLLCECLNSGSPNHLLGRPQSLMSLTAEIKDKDV